MSKIEDESKVQEVCEFEIPDAMKQRVKTQERKLELERERQRLQREWQRLDGIRAENKAWLVSMLTSQKQGSGIPEDSVPENLKRRIQAENKSRNLQWVEYALRQGGPSVPLVYWKIFVELRSGKPRSHHRVANLNPDMELSNQYWNGYIQYYLSRGVSQQVLYAMLARKFALGEDGVPKDSAAANQYAAFAFSEPGLVYNASNLENVLKSLPLDSLVRALGHFIVAGESKNQQFLYDLLDLTKKENIDLAVQVLDECAKQESRDISGNSYYRSIKLMQQSWNEIPNMLSCKRVLGAPFVAALAYIVIFALCAAFSSFQILWGAWASVAGLVCLFIVDICSRQKWKRGLETYVSLISYGVKLPASLKKFLSQKFDDYRGKESISERCAVYLFPLLLVGMLAYDAFTAPGESWGLHCLTSVAEPFQMSEETKSKMTSQGYASSDSKEQRKAEAEETAGEKGETTSEEYAKPKQNAVKTPAKTNVSTGTSDTMEMVLWVIGGLLGAVCIFFILRFLFSSIIFWLILLGVVWMLLK